MQKNTNFEELEVSKTSWFCWTQNIMMSCFMLFLVSGIVSYVKERHQHSPIVIALSLFMPTTETAMSKCPRWTILISLQTDTVFTSRGKSREIFFFFVWVPKFDVVRLYQVLDYLD